MQEVNEAMASALAGASGLADAHQGWDTGSRVLTQFPVTDSGVWGLPGTGEAGRVSQAGWAVLDVGGLAVLAVSAHLAWGARAERLRSTQMAALLGQVDAHADTADVVVLGADFNAGPDAACARMLSGEVATVDQYWVPAPSDGPTVDPSRNRWAAYQAARLGSDPDRVPARTVDQLWVRGWVHGRLGDPVRSFRVPGSGAASDHEAVAADLDLCGQREPASIVDTADGPTTVPAPAAACWAAV